jgi:hypothetical protein
MHEWIEQTGKDKMKDFLQGVLIAILIIVSIVFLVLLFDSITLFEDGSFTGCLPFTICNLP